MQLKISPGDALINSVDALHSSQQSFSHLEKFSLVKPELSNEDKVPCSWILACRSCNLFLTTVILTCIQTVDIHIQCNNCMFGVHRNGAIS